LATRAGSKLVGEEFEADGIYAHPDHAEFAGGSEREVDDAVFGENSPVGDGDDDGALVTQVGDADLAAEGQGAVSGVTVVYLCGATATGIGSGARSCLMVVVTGVVHAKTGMIACFAKAAMTTSAAMVHAARYFPGRDAVRSFPCEVSMT
jgi:hypothetical protein